MAPCWVLPLRLRLGLQVEVKRAQRDFQTAEIMGLSMREQLGAREAELSELTSRHSQLQQEQLAAASQLLESQSSLGGLQLLHEGLQASSAERVQQLEGALEAERAALADTQRQLAAVQAEALASQRGLQETAARETAVTAQLRQLAGAHEQQTSKLRQETDARRNGEDELQAIRAGLQVCVCRPAAGAGTAGAGLQQQMPCPACSNSWTLSPLCPCTVGCPSARPPAGHPAAAGGAGPGVCQPGGAPHRCRGLARHRAHQHGPPGGGSCEPAAG